LAALAAGLAMPCLALALGLGARLGAPGLAVAGAMALFAAGVWVAVSGMIRSYPHARLGAANAVTLLRLALIAPLAVAVPVGAALAADPAAGWVLLAVALVALSLDGLDGWLARRSGLVSAFGARFDMEVDAVLAAMLAILVWQTGAAGPWVLVLGFARYAFVAAAVVWPWLLGDLPESLARKAVCVLQIGTLIACLAPVVAPPVSTLSALVASVALAWSFGRDILWLHRRARHGGSGAA
jgi:phosphatidylglycerophosphate synthase